MREGGAGGKRITGEGIAEAAKTKQCCQPRSCRHCRHKCHQHCRPLQELPGRAQHQHLPGRAQHQHCWQFPTSTAGRPRKRRQSRKELHPRQHCRRPDHQHCRQYQVAPSTSTAGNFLPALPAGLKMACEPDFDRDQFGTVCIYFVRPRSILGRPFHPYKPQGRPLDEFRPRFR